MSQNQSDQGSDDDEGPPLAVPLNAHSIDDTGIVVEPDASTAADDSAVLAVPSSDRQALVPVLLLTGYLGAGKSTLVNHILSAKHGFRCAVLLNEIGDTADVERALVKEPEVRAALTVTACASSVQCRAVTSCCCMIPTLKGGCFTQLLAGLQSGEATALTDWVQLENGCICCSVKNDMVQALEALVQQRDRFDYVIIETTGLANPGPVAAALWTDPGLETTVCLDAVVTVVDARNALRQLGESREDGSVNEAQQQVAFADVVLLNKTDLVNEATLARVEAEVAAINSEAVPVRCERCNVDLAVILHTGLYSAAGAGRWGAAAAPEAAEAAATGSKLQEPDAHTAAEHDHAASSQHEQGKEHEHDHSGHEGPCDAQCSHPPHAHDQRVRTVTLRLDRPVSLPSLRHWLDELLWERGDGAGGMRREDVFRVKGLLWVAGSERKWVLQAVHELYDVTEGPEWGEGEHPRGSKIVFIGRHLVADALLRDVQLCCVDGADSV